MWLTLWAACAPEKVVGEEGLERADLGTFTSDADGYATVPYTVPDAAVSSLVLCGPYGHERLMSTDVTDPSGELAYDDDDPYARPSRVGTHSDLLPVLFPTAPELDVSAGDWSLTLYADGEAGVSVTCAATHRIQEVGDPSTLDLRLVFVGVDGVDLTADSGPGLLEGVLAQFGDILGGAGLDVGDVQYADFSGDVDTYTSVDGDEEFGGLLRDAGDERSLTFFFVQDITDEEGTAILGLSGGPPGAAANGGTSKSGVVVKAADFGTDEGNDQIAHIMAHEALHFLGLFHTTEKDGDHTDPLSDTPECSDDGGDGTMNTDDCAGAGADNIMFWTGTDTGVSSDQGWVVERSAAVR